MDSKFIKASLSKKILLIGVKLDTPGGMAAVVNSYNNYFDGMKYITTWKVGNIFTKIFYAINAIILFLWKVLWDRDIKIIHIHGAANASFKRKAIFIHLGKLFEKKVILHMHAADFEQYYENHKNKKGIVRTLNKCDKLIVLSNFWAQYFDKIGMLNSKIEVLNNIVSPPQHLPTHKEIGKINFLFLGEIGYRKGVFDLLKAISENREFLQDKIILRIGGNEVDGNIKEFIRSENLESFVYYEGWISGNKKIECLNWADVYVLPSYNEGLPIAILEAMSYSQPIISTRVGGIPEVINSYNNGILIEPGNIEQIKDALLFFIENPKKIKEYGEKSHDIVQPYFPPFVFKHLEVIYASLLNN